MSVPTAEPTAPPLAAAVSSSRSEASGRFGGWRLYLAMIGGALVLAALSLLFPSTPSYDPWSWLVWGREILHGTLHTPGGPTWKPLPVVFTTVLAVFRSAQPDLWLVVARAGAVVAVMMTFRLAWRLTWWLRTEVTERVGVPSLDFRRVAEWAPAALAGVIAGIALGLSGKLLSDSALGYSEALATAALLIGLERHLDGKPREAFALGFVAALARPEIWPYWGLYGLWLMWKDPGSRKLVVGLAVLTLVLWFVPQKWGGGSWLSGFNRAQHPRHNSPAFAACPFCSELVHHAWPLILLRVKIAAVLVIGLAGFVLGRAGRARAASGVRERGLARFAPHGPRERGLAALALCGLFGFSWWILIALETQAGFSGNDRYLVIGSAFIEICGAGGFGWAAIELARWARERAPGTRDRLHGPAALAAASALGALVFALVPNFVGPNLIDLSRTHRSLIYQATLRKDLVALINRAGGVKKLERCGAGRVMIEGFQVPMTAWYFGVRTIQILDQPADERRRGRIAALAERDLPGPRHGQRALAARVEDDRRLDPRRRSLPGTHDQGDPLLRGLRRPAQRPGPGVLELMATASAQRPRRVGGVELRIPIPVRPPERLTRVPTWAWIGAILVVLCAIGAYFRLRYVSYEFWMDEAITVGIASHHLTQIPGVLRNDGSPPLFYMILHVWMSLFGDSEASTHTLTAVIGTLTVPVGMWAGWSLFGRRAGIIAAIMFAFNAFIIVYSGETRMYVLMSLWGVLATAGFLHGFVYRRRRYVLLYGISQALMLYTHAWSLFFGASTAIAIGILYRIGDESSRKNLIKDAVLAYAGAGVLFLPWLPTFLFQTAHTAAPWDTAPQFGAPVQLSRNIMGGDRVTAAVVLASAVGLAPLFVKSQRRSRDAQLMWSMITLIIATLALAWIASHITPAWVPRYFAPVVAPIVLLAAMGMSRAGVIGVAGVVIALAFLIFPDAYTPLWKSDMQDVGAEMAPRLHPGDLVIVSQPEQTPLNYYYLPAGLKFDNIMSATPLRDPTYMNWADALKRLRRAKPDKIAPKLLASLRPGQQVLFVRPMTEGAGNWFAPWTELVRLRAAQWSGIIGSDKQLVPVAWAPHYYPGACCVADSAVLYKKVS